MDVRQQRSMNGWNSVLQAASREHVGAGRREEGRRVRGKEKRRKEALGKGA